MLPRRLAMGAVTSSGKKPAINGLRSAWLWIASRSASSTATTTNQQNPDTMAAARQHSYAHTLQLPQTAFGMRPDQRLRPTYLKRTTDDLYQWQAAQTDRPAFILHDGPPYANGDVHTGHALNKILKDVINRHQLLEGRTVHYVPGFDCHGMPIEHKALQEAAKEAKKQKLPPPKLAPLEVRARARALATATVATQTAAFKGFAVMGDWERPYLTMAPEYVTRQLKVFEKMVEHGLIYRQNKPVYFSPSTQTALAEAELEYEEHTSTSVYVKMPFLTGPTDSTPVSALIWTTTPWTLPANQAIAVHADLEYAVIAVASSEHWLVGVDRLADLPFLRTDDGEPAYTVVRTMQGRDLVGWTYRAPFKTEPCPVVAADYVTADSGTGLVHTAPGHGMDDYLTGLKHGLAVFSPVDDYGKFTSDTLPELVGKPVLGNGTTAVLDLLTAQNVLVHQHKYVHKYPYDWRSKKPVIQRATPQWFAAIDAIKTEATSAVNAIAMVPETGRTRLRRYVADRSEWCISRQRAWGVPIPVVYHAESGEPFMTPQSVAHIAHVLEANGGVDAWWTLPDEAFVLPEMRAKGPWKKGTDTMDVWFDSGTSWTLLGNDTVADVYFEGSDQHRGWFQSALLTSIATRGYAPYKKIITHGFLVDEKKQKMSKSIGNVVAPDTIINGGSDKKAAPGYGVDGLRLWVAMAEYTRDIALGKQVLASAGEAARKIRNTCRYLLGNLYGIDASVLVLPAEGLTPLDRYVLHELGGMSRIVQAAYRSHAYYKAVQAINVFTNNVLSAVYFEALKDRLYADAPTSSSRRAAQSVLANILVHYSQAIAPILPLMVEEIYDHGRHVLSVPRADKNEADGYFVARTWEEAPTAWDQPALADDFGKLITVRNAANQLLEQLRRDKLIKTNQEAELTLSTADPAFRAFLEPYASTLQSLVVSSHVYVTETPDADAKYVSTPDHVEAGLPARLTLTARRARAHKCPRCWNFWSATEGALCTRCTAAVSGRP
ncbi:hypothetical protein GGF31_005078 [Allomyces arbusculus]|nr:hypothetical protein GGF31_005078 [Allomyces arbusculus]